MCVVEMSAVIAQGCELTIQENMNVYVLIVRALTIDIKIKLLKQDMPKKLPRTRYERPGKRSRWENEQDTLTVAKPNGSRRDH